MGLEVDDAGNSQLGIEEKREDLGLFLFQQNLNLVLYLEKMFGWIKLNFERMGLNIKIEMGRRREGLVSGPEEGNRK